MQKQDTAALLCQYIETELAGSAASGTLAADTPLIENGFVDSLGLFKLVAFLEDNLQVTLAPEEIVIENFESVNAIVRLVESKKRGTAA